MPQSIEDTDRPVDPALNKITIAEEEERDLIAHGGLSIDDERQDMRNRYLVRAILVDAAAFEAARTLDDPDVFAQVAVVQVDAELPRPECKEPVEVIDILAGIPVMPAIDEADDLVAPGPVAARMYPGIHGGLHLVQVVHLVVQATVISPHELGIEGTQNDGSGGLQRVNCAGTHIEEARKI